LAQRPLISELLVGNCGKAPGTGLYRRCTRHWSLGTTETSLYQLKDLTSRFQPALDRKNRSRGAPLVANSLLLLLESSEPVSLSLCRFGCLKSGALVGRSLKGHDGGSTRVNWIVQLDERKYRTRPIHGKRSSLS
jgi:hypothetical protein